MYYLKTIVKKILNFFNLEVLPVDNRKAYFIGPTKTTRSYGTFFKRILLNGNSISNDEIIKKLIKTDSPIIFDVGASHGDSIERFKALFQNSYIYSFEPLRKEFDLIKKKETDKIKCFNFAFGDVEEEKKFNVHDSMSFFSSFNKYNDQYFKPGDNKFSNYNVKIKTLDNFLKDQKIINKIDLLKIDTQGYEEKILEGGKEAIKNNLFKIIEIELHIGNLYGQSHKNFIDVEKHLIKNNYRLISIDRWGNLLQKPYLEFNLIYVCKKYFEI
jgi:FkbM family methyltransferase